MHIISRKALQDMNTTRHNDMKHNVKPYSIPEEESATYVAEEAMVTSQYYSKDSTMEICVPTKDVSLAIEMFNRMGWIIVTNRDEIHTLQDKFNTLYDAWWKETCIYSGPNLCYNNDNFRLIKKMGQAVLPLIELKKSTTPSYMHRHLDWLKKGILS